jgi:type IV pilus assembly protein PilQ
VGGLTTAGSTTGATSLAGELVKDTKPDILLDGTAVNLPAPKLSSGAIPGQFAFTLFNAGATRFLNLELNALESDGKGKIISSPRVVTANQTEASIEQGTELPYQSATSSGATAVSFRKAVLSLKVKPQITPDGNVIIDVQVHKDSPGVQTTGGVSIDTKNVATTVLVENGGTVVIGGIYQQTESSQVNKVPFLGDIPGLGFFFRNSLRSDAKTELLVFITPRIVDDRVSLR